MDENAFYDKAGSFPSIVIKKISWFAWVIAAGLIIFTCYLGWKKWSESSIQPVNHGMEMDSQPIPTEILQSSKPFEALPKFQNNQTENSIPRVASLKTDIQNWQKQEMVEYSVGLGDSIFGIAQDFNIQPETVLWSNYDVLKDNPHAISAGMVLKIPPVDGVLYLWK